MKLVKQREFGQCVVACIAMVLGKELDDVLPDFDTTYGTTDDVLIEYLAQHGVAAISSLVWPSFTTPALVTVPSLNHPGFLHKIVWDGERYLDPSTGPLTYPNNNPINPNTRERVDHPQWSDVILLWPQVT